MDAAGSESFVERVEAELSALLPASGPGTLLSAARHLVFAGGRRMRVRLVASCGELAGTRAEELVAVAAATELIHVASLLHDDIVDEARERRGKPSANARFGNQAAVLAGDWVLAKAMVLLERHPRLVVSAVKTVAEMSEAAIAEIEGRGTLAGDLTRWRWVAEGKTGALFGWCASSAAAAGGLDALAPGLDRFGRHLGIAFQLADDVSDLVGANGKDRFSDLRSATPSYPILLAARQDPALARRIETAWKRGAPDEAEVSALGEVLLASGAREATLAELHRELDLGLEALGPGAQAFSSRLRSLAEVFVKPLLA
jgi:geranylgeranyl pyrophosphate synthase